MKAIQIALKDLVRSYRSAFALMFMFGIPLFVTGMFYLMFGNQSTQPEASLALPVTRVVIANLDAGDKALAQSLVLSSGTNGAAAGSLGDLVVDSLQSPALAEFMQISLAADEASARVAVDTQAADVAILIPAHFSADFSAKHGQASLIIYQAPALTTGAEIVIAVLGQVADGLSGNKIAVDTVLAGDYRGDLQSAAVLTAQQYLQASAAFQDPAALIELHAPVQPAATSSPLTSIIGPIMGGMMIFFAFFTAGSTALSILKESEEGTLARLFTTPTRQATILGGKFLAVGLTVLVQVTLLLIVANQVFHIAWGALGAVVCAAVGIIACAAAFGIFLASLMRTTRQGGAVFGGLMTVTGMLGMITIFTGGSAGAVERVALLTPQGWAVRGLTLAMQGASLNETALNLLVLLALSGLFMGAGIYRFQKRYA